jgi:hypothetical protein
MPRCLPWPYSVAAIHLSERHPRAIMNPHSTASTCPRKETDMDAPISRNLRLLFLVHAIVSIVPGVVCILIPGRFLAAMGWVRPDPLVTRLLGAVIFGLGWGSWLGFRATRWREVRLLVLMEIGITVAGSIALFRDLLLPHPFRLSLTIRLTMVFPWVVFALFVFFALAWIVVYVRAPRT